jgi:hypothetical protein
MNVDDFDTYVTSKGFIFEEVDNKESYEGVSYALNLNEYDSKATKFIELYQRYYDYKYAIYYQTLDKNEYLNIKNQIKSLGFILEDSGPSEYNGKTSYKFFYKKGKTKIHIYSRATSFEINCLIDY